MYWNKYIWFKKAFHDYGKWFKSRSNQFLLVKHKVIIYSRFFKFSYLQLNLLEYELVWGTKLLLQGWYASRVGAFAIKSQIFFQL